MRPNRYLDDVERERILLEIEREELWAVAVAYAGSSLVAVAIVVIYLVLR